MTLKESLKAEIGDRLTTLYNTGNWDKGDEMILIEKSPDYQTVTDGFFYNKTKNTEQGGNIQSMKYATKFN